MYDLEEIVGNAVLNGRDSLHGSLLKLEPRYEACGESFDEKTPWQNGSSVFRRHTCTCVQMLYMF